MGICASSTSSSSSSSSSSHSSPPPSSVPAASSSSSSSSSSSPSPSDVADSLSSDDIEVDVDVVSGDFRSDFPSLDSVGNGIPVSGDAALSFWDRDKTVRPEKKSNNIRLQNTVKATMKATLGGGDLLLAVKLPKGEQADEWIAVNTVHFFNAASLIYGTCSDFCTDVSCPSMMAGRAEYLWKDSNKYKKPTKVSAPLYIELLLTWVDDQLSNPQIFPVEDGEKFPRNFMTVVKNIYKRLFRLYAHLYCAHAEKIRAIGANAHLNTCFKHFIYFVAEFNLCEKSDMTPLEKLINKMREKDN